MATILGDAANKEAFAQELAQVSRESWWADYERAYSGGRAGLEAFLATNPAARYADYSPVRDQFVRGQVNYFVAREQDRELFGFIPLSPRTYERVGEIAGSLAVAGMAAGAVYGIGAAAGYFGSAPASITESGLSAAGGSSAAPTSATFASGAGGEIALETSALEFGPFGGFDAAAVAGADYTAVSAPALAGAAEKFGTESLVYGGIDPYANYAAALPKGTSLLETVREVTTVVDKIYSVGSKVASIFGFTGAARPATGPGSGYAPSLVSPYSTGGLFGSIYPGGEFGGGPLSGFLPGTGADKGGTLTEFLRSSSGLATLLGIALLIGGIILFMRR